MIEQIFELVKTLAWPVVALLVFLILRKEIRILVQSVSQRATKISTGRVSIELATNQLQEKALAEQSSEKDKVRALRNIEMAKGLAEKFDYWMKTYNHPKQPDILHFLDWLVADRGADYIGDDYGLYTILAEVLRNIGYQTMPPPNEAQFKAKLFEHECRLRERASRK